MQSQPATRPRQQRALRSMQAAAVATALLLMTLATPSKGQDLSPFSFYDGPWWAVACEGTPLTMSCANFPGTGAGDTIKIDYAFYGRYDTTTCPYPGGSWATTNTGCTGYATALAEAAAQCNGLQTCTPLFYSGDPCLGTYKYKEATYNCTAAPANQYAVGPACDGAPFTLTCPAGSITSIVSTFYGRSDSTTCDSGVPSQMANTTCILPSAGQDVASQCLGRNSCTPNLVDPCYGTYKWKTAVFTCG